MYKKKVCAFLLILVMLVTLLPHSLAAADVPDEEMRIIALNSPVVFGFNYEWQITKETILYNSAETVVAVCFDMENTDEAALAADMDDEVPATAYAIVNMDKQGNPILLFGVFGVSPYYDVNVDRSYYLGSMEYYGESDGTYFNLTTDEVAEYETFSSLDASNMVVRNIEDYSVAREQFLNPTDESSLRAAANGTKTLSGVPNLQWRKGCAPTAVAMLINTKYISYSGTAMIDSLALKMNTGSNGGTDFPNIVAGTKSYISSNSNMVTPAVCGWPNANSANSPYRGLTYNTKEAYQNSINLGYPVGVGLDSSNVTTSGYPNGIGAHMMAGIGYSFATSGDYVICQTTNVADGKVYFPLTSTGLKNHYWFLLIWSL